MFQRVCFAVCIVLTPLVAILYAILNPTALGAKSGQVALAVNTAANPTANQVHLVLGIVLSFLLPLAFLGMAWLSLRRAPWLATIAGLLALLGWIPWSALIAQEGLAYTMVQMGGGTQFALLWERFNGDFVIHTYLLIYIIGHLLSTVLLAWALGRTRLIPVWAAWAFALSSPLQIVTFVLHLFVVILIAFLLWFLASIPAALALLHDTDDRVPGNGSV
jgi:hypothetical protein